MRRFVIAWLLLVFAAESVHSQLVSKDVNQPAMKALMNGTVFVLATDDDAYNQWLARVMEEHWTVRPYRLIHLSQADSFIGSDKNLFFFAQCREDKGTAMRLATSSDLAAKKELIFMLIQGGVKQSKFLFTPALTGPKVISAYRFSPDRAEETAGMFEAEMLIAYLNQSLNLILSNNIKGSVKDSVRDRISSLAPQIQDKTMLFNEAYSDGTIMLEKKPLISDKVIKDYPYRHKMVNKFNLSSHLNDGSISPCYLFLYFPSQYVNQVDDSGDLLVYDPVQKMFLYAEDNYGGPWMEKWELKDMLYLVR
ncbi:MAG: hypothetical protein RMK52_07455 [Chitinophagales bacterium]|nr:hypothetical protein [Chitinophagales bacterium]MDW8394064.1 hypothetical protein [Chitinophagales bacterium]